MRNLLRPLGFVVLALGLLHLIAVLVSSQGINWSGGAFLFTTLGLAMITASYKMEERSGRFLNSLCICCGAAMFGCGVFVEVMRDGDISASFFLLMMGFLFVWTAISRLLPQRPSPVIPSNLEPHAYCYRPLEPMPVAEGSLVLRWLQRMRIGALCGLAVILYSVACILLHALGISLQTRLGALFACASSVAGGAGVWLLVSPEPLNGRWLWLCRWTLRLFAGVDVLLFGLIFVACAIFRPAWNQGAQDAMLDANPMVGGIVVGAFALLCWFLKTLSDRLGDRTLRRNFAVLTWIVGAILILTIMLSVSRIRFHDGIVQWPSAMAPDTPQKVSSPPDTTGLWVVMALCGWLAWLMWRLSWRLNRCAGYYRKLSGPSPATNAPAS